eukprot:2957439-Ditylum_brightwellii.AAC.1
MSDDPLLQPFPLIHVDVLEAYKHVPINLQEYLLFFNQLEREEDWEPDHLNDYPSERAWKNLEIYNFDAQLEKVVKEHNN